MQHPKTVRVFQSFSKLLNNKDWGKDSPDCVYFFGCSWDGIANTVAKSCASSYWINHVLEQLCVAYQDGRVWFVEPGNEEVQFQQMVDKVWELSGDPSPVPVFAESAEFWRAPINNVVMQEWFRFVNARAVFE